jgi:hypothetical protein
MSATESSSAKKRIVDKTNVPEPKSPKVNKKSSPKSARSIPKIQEEEVSYFALFPNPIRLLIRKKPRSETDLSGIIC